MFSSFFAELMEMRSEVGDENLGDWCHNELHIDLTICNNIANVLKAAEAAVIKSNLEAARKLEREQKKAAAKIARIEREEERAAREAEKQKKVVEVAQALKKKQKEQRKSAKAVDRLAELIPPAASLTTLLEKYAASVKKSRIEHGQLFWEMKCIVDRHDAGKDEEGKYWTWSKWAERYIQRSRRDIKKCIQEYEVMKNDLANGALCPISEQNSNDVVVPIRTRS